MLLIDKIKCYLRVENYDQGEYHCVDRKLSCPTLVVGMVAVHLHRRDGRVQMGAWGDS